MLFKFLTTFVYSTCIVYKPQKSITKLYILVYQPQYRSKPNYLDYANFYQIKIVLHYLQYVYPSLLQYSYKTQTFAYTIYLSKYIDSYLYDYIILLPLKNNDKFKDEFYINNDEANALILLASKTINQNLAMQTKDLDVLGERTTNQQYNQLFYINTYSIEGLNLNSILDIYVGLYQQFYIRELYSTRASV